MARIRTIKPEFFTSEDIVSLSPFARLLYIAIWCESDREGRLVWKPKTFKMRYFPADPINIDEHCGELVRGGLVTLYGDGLAYIPRFLCHQHINNRESESRLEPPPIDDATTTRETRVNDAPQSRREEGKGKEHIYDASNFDAFWSAYPKKKSKGDAEKAFKALKVDDDMLARILTTIEAVKLSKDWQKDNGQFIPYPATWLRNKGWEDEAIAAGAGGDEWEGAR